jgi:hypothetical protein
MNVNGINVWIAPSLIYTYTPLTGMTHSLCLLLMYLVGSGLIILCLHLSFPSIRPMGISVVLMWFLYDYVRVYGLPYRFMKISPAALARISFLSAGYDMRLPSLRYAYTFLSLEIIVPGFLLLLRSRIYTVDKYIWT